MREAARLQSFDDDFRFITSDNETLDTTRPGIGMDMIGEAVPPLLSKAIALHLAAQLDTRDVSAKSKTSTDKSSVKVLSDNASPKVEKKSASKAKIKATNATV